MLSQHSRAEGMESCDSWATRFVLAFSASRAGEQLGHALFHFPGGLVCERHSQDVLWRDVAVDHARDTICDDARLARARSRENQYRTMDCFHGQALLWIERMQVQHRAGSVGVEPVIARRRNDAIPKPARGREWAHLADSFSRDVTRRA